jgi:hypothetical protein
MGDDQNISLAVLGDEQASWQPSGYGYAFFLSKC